MIGSHNIGDYIKFLYRQKYNSVAPEDLVQSWQRVPEQHISSELHRLYAHWGLSETEVEDLALRFSTENNTIRDVPGPQAWTNPPQPSQNQYNAAPPYQPIPPTPATRSRLLPVLLGVVLLIGIAAAGIYFLREDTPSDARNDASVLSSTEEISANDNKILSEELKAQLREVDSLKSEVKRVKDSLAASMAEVRASGSTVSDTRDRDISNILGFVYAEESRNLNEAIGYLALNMQQYWGLKNPTRQQLIKNYQKVWEKSGNPRHEDIYIEPLGNRTYDMHGTYHFYSYTDQVYRKVPVHTRFVLDESGKIVKTHGVKN